MANDSHEVVEPLDFHPCNTPRGMTYYRLEELTKEQQRQLFEQKLEIVRENQKYLNEHPEVRAVVDIVLRAVLQARPKIKLRYFLAKYFAENFDKIEETIKSFIAEPSATNFYVDDILEEDIKRSESSSTISSLESDEPSFLCILKGEPSFDFLQMKPPKETDFEIQNMCAQIVQDILEYVCRDDIVKQIKLFSGNQSQQYDSDPMLAFPFENNHTPSLTSYDDAATFMGDEAQDGYYKS